jgi:hypothetical protein
VFVVSVTAFVPFWRVLGDFLVGVGLVVEVVVVVVGLMGVFLMGVLVADDGAVGAGSGFVVVVVDAFLGVLLVAALVAFDAAALSSGLVPEDCRGMGRGFLVPMGVRVRITGGFVAVAGAFLGVVLGAVSDVVVAFLVEAGGRGFFVPIGVLLGFSFSSDSAVVCFCSGLGVSGAFGVSFLGVLFTGVADVVSFVPVEAGVFFSDAVVLVAGFGSGLEAWICFEAFETFSTLSCNAAFCFFSPSSADILDARGSRFL